MAYVRSPFRVFVQFVLVIVLLLGISPVIRSQTEIDLKQTIEFVKVGQKIDQEIKGLDSHSYKIALKTGQYLQVFLETEKLAVEVNILAPSGENVLHLETDSKKNNRENLEVIARNTGDYLLEVISLDDISKPSRYSFELKDIHKALLKDRNRVRAKELTDQADLLQKVSTPLGFEKSVERYLAAIPYWQKVGEQSSLADVYRKLAESYYLISKHQESINYFTKELDIRQSNNNKSGEARSIKNLGIVYYAMGDDEQAIKHYSQALALAKEINNRELIAQTLNLLGVLHRSNGEIRKSIEYNKESLNVWEELNETEETFKIIEDIANSYYSLAELKDAIKFYEKTLLLADKNNVFQAKILFNMANIYNEIGDFSHALSYYEQTLNAWQGVRSPSNELRATEVELLNTVGKIHYKLKDNTQALNSLEKAFALARENQDRLHQAQLLNDLANVYRDNGEGRKAIELYSDAFTLHKQNNDLLTSAITAIEVGKTHLELGDGDKAVGFLTEAYKLNQRSGGNRAIEAKIFYHLGVALEFNYDEEKAIASYKQGIMVAKELQDKLQEAQFNYRLALLQKRRGNLKEAQLNIETAIGFIENLPSKVVNQNLQINYFCKVANYFELYIDLLMQQHKLNPNNGNDIAALKVSEQAKAYALLDLMTPTKVDFSVQSDKNLILQERELKQLISYKTARLVKFNVIERSLAEIGEAEREIKALSSQLKELQAEIRQKNSHYTNFSQPKPFDLKQLQEQILDQDTVLLAYSLGNEQSYLWLITQKEVKSFSLPKRSEIESLAKYLRELITARNLLAKGENIGGRPMTLELAASEYPKVATELSKILLSPLAKDLGNKRLVIIPDGVLQYIPFNALAEPSKTDTYQPLLVSHEVVSLPSVTTISVLRDENKENKENKEKAKKVLFIVDPVFSIVDSRVKNKANQSSNLATNKLNELEEANLLVKQSAKEVGLSVTSQGLPRLSLVNDEIKQINELAPIESKQLLSFNASLSNLASETSSYKVIHFATYGLANGQHPDLSGIVLSLVDEQGKPQEGFLQPDKIFNLNLSTELLTLNCDTQIGKNMQGEGLSGLTRSFIYAGASRVMVNLWNTNDPASIELIKRFYEKILKENQSPTIALRQVQLEMLQDEKYQSPFYWAGFQLQGEWK